MSGRNSNPDVRDQYARWIYPEPVTDVEKLVASGADIYGDPGDQFYRIWPERQQFSPSILVPGCGTSLAPILAFKNPRSRVVGVDISQASLKHSKALKKKHGLKNLELKHLDLNDVESLNEKFDYIVATGVLHHLPDPVSGAQCLRKVLAPQGAMNIMMYGQALRIGVYMMQRVFQELDFTQSEADVRLAQRTIQAAPQKHAVRRYVEAVNELDYLGAVVDTFLHPQDRAYYVDEIYDFAEQAGLEFQEWLDPSQYCARGVLSPQHPLYQRIDEQPLRKQAIILDRLNQSLGTHRFLLRDSTSNSEDFAIDFKSSEFWSWIPHKHPLLKVQQKLTHQGVVYALKRGKKITHVNVFLAALCDAIDGTRTVTECMQHLVAKGAKLADDSSDAVLSAFETLYGLGHITFQKTKR